MPVELVTAWVDTFVATFFATTFTPGTTASDASVTRPVIVPRDSCALEFANDAATMAHIAVLRRNIAKHFLSPRSATSPRPGMDDGHSWPCFGNAGSVLEV